MGLWDKHKKAAEVVEKVWKKCHINLYMMMTRGWRIEYGSGSIILVDYLATKVHTHIIRIWNKFILGTELDLILCLNFKPIRDPEMGASRG